MVLCDGWMVGFLGGVRDFVGLLINGIFHMR
jgi:hypothetical protein